MNPPCCIYRSPEASLVLALHMILSNLILSVAQVCLLLREISDHDLITLQATIVYPEGGVW